MFRMIASIALAASLAACATTGAAPMDKAALSKEVFALSGQTQEVRAALRFAAPLALAGVGDVGERCRKAMGKDAGPLGRAACEMADAAMGTARAGGSELTKGLDQALVALEARGARAMEETYTTEELLAMRRFYASEAGRGIVAKRAEFWANLAKGG